MLPQPFQCIILLCVFSYSNAIIGGISAEEGQFKYAASIRMNNFHFCGGAVISDKIILTTASCNLGGPLGDLTVVVGAVSLDTGGDHYNISRFFAHEGWHQSSLENDIAVIEVVGRISFNELVQPIKLPTQNIVSSNGAIVIGWGVTLFPDGPAKFLHWLEVEELSLKDCKKLHFPNIIRENQLCTLVERGRGICNRDFGGPLVKDDVLIGVAVTTGYFCAMGTPEFYTRVFSFMQWIKQNI